MNDDDRGEAIFGGFDGMTSALGAIAGAVIAGASARNVVVISVGLSVSSAVSMAGGEWLADGAEDGRRRRAGAMGVATLVGTLLPVAGFLGGRTLGVYVAVVATIVGGVVVARMRSDRLLTSLQRTFGVLALAAGLSIIAAVALGATG